jgi:hypothetical protein
MIDDEVIRKKMQLWPVSNNLSKLTGRTKEEFPMRIQNNHFTA